MRGVERHDRRHHALLGSCRGLCRNPSRLSTAQLLDILGAEAELTPDTIIADIGSGTGLSAEMFLKNGNPVFGIEPNREMRLAAERLLAAYPSFRSVDGAAEATTLSDSSIDLIVAGQAFHWFDPQRAQVEFAAVLRAGWTCRVDVEHAWNRYVAVPPCLRQLLQEYGTDYREVVHTNVDQAKLTAFFGGGFRTFRLDNEQQFDREGLHGRTRSSSFTPTPDDPAISRR